MTAATTIPVPALALPVRVELVPTRFEDEWPEAAATLMALAQGELLPPESEPVHWRILPDGRIVESDPNRTPGFRVIRVTPAPRYERNEPCPCGSGRKYKKCHGR